MIQINPQPLPVLKQRFVDALKKLHNVKDIIKGTAPAPSGNAENVFDFEEGIRIIISRELYQEKVWLHFSGSITDAYKGPTDVQILGVIVKLFVELSGAQTTGLVYIGQSTDKRIPHWIIPLNDLN